METFLYGNKEKISIPELITKEKAGIDVDILHTSQKTLSEFLVDENSIGKITKEGAEAFKLLKKEGKEAADVTSDTVIKASTKLRDTAIQTQQSFGQNGLLGTLKNIGSSVMSAAANMGLSWLIDKGLSLLISGIDDIIHREEKLIEKGEEAKKLIDDLDSDYSNKQSLIDQSGSSYAKLREKVGKNNENLGLTSEEYEQFLNINSQLAETFPNIISGVDSQGNAILDLGNNAETTTQKLNDLLEQEKEYNNLKIAENVQTVYEGNIASIKQLQDQYEEHSSEVKKYQDLLQTPNISSGKIVFDSNMSKENLETMRMEVLKTLAGNGDRNIIIPEESWTENGDYVLSFDPDMIDTDSLTALQNKINSIVGNEGKETKAKLKDALTLQSGDQKEIKATWNSGLRSLILSLNNYDEYSSLSDELKTAINSQIEKIDPVQEWMDDKGNWNVPKDIRRYLREKYIDPISQIYNDTSDEGKVAQKALEDLMSLSEKTDLTVSEYKAKANKSSKKYQSNGIDQDPLVALKNYADANKFSYVDLLEKLGIYDTNDSGMPYLTPALYIKDINDALPEGSEWKDQLGDKLSEALTVEQAIQIHTKMEEDPSASVETLVKDAINGVQKAVDDTPSISFSSLFTGDDGNQSDFSKTVDKFQSDMDSLKSALDSLSTKNLDSSGLTDLIQEFPQLAGQTDNLEAAIENLKVDKLKSFMAEVKKVSDNVTDPTEQAKLDNYVQNIVDSVDLSKVDAKNFRSTLTDVLFKDSDLEGSAKTGPLTQFSKIINNLLSDLDDSVETEWTKEIVLKLAIKNEDASTWDYSEWMKQIQDEMTRQQKNLTFESLIGDNGKLSSAISTYTTEMEKLTSAKQKLSQTGSVISESEMGSLLSDVPELKNYVDDLDGGLESLINTVNTNVIDTFTQEIERLKLAGKDADASALQAYLENLKSTASEIESAYGKIGGMTVNTPLLNDYDKALETKNEGAIYDKIKEVAKATKELYDAGDYGVDEFKAGAKVFSMSGSTTVADFEENYPKIERYLLQDSDTQGVQNFFEDLQTKGYASLETAADGTQYWTTQIDDLNKAATDMGMTYEWFMGMLGEADDKGFISDFVGSTQEGIDHLSDLYGELGTKQAKLSELESSGETDNTTLSNIERLNSEIEELQGRIETTREGLEKLFTVDTQDAATKVQAGKDAIAAMQEELLKLDPNDENYESIQAVIMDQIQAIAQKYHIELEPEVQTDEVSSQTQEAVEKAQSVADRNPVTVKIKSTSQVQAPTSTVTQGVSTAAQTVSVNADNSSAIGKVSEVANTAKNKKATVPIDGNPSGFLSKVAGAKTQVEANKAIISVDANTNPLKNSIANALAGEHHISVTASVHGVNIPGAAASAGGTLHAHASGTAYNVLNLRAHASGTDVGLKQDENALVNELGNEGLVRDGKLYEIPGGTHIQSLKRGDVVINHKQWEQIKKYGSTDSFAGTAYAQGSVPLMHAYSGVKKTPNGKSSGKNSSLVKQTKVVAADTKATTANTKAKKKNTSATNKSTSTLDKFTKKMSNVIDWVAVKLSRQQRDIDMDKTKADLSIGYGSKNSNLSAAQAMTTALMDTNIKGAAEYKSYANEIYNGYKKLSNKQFSKDNKKALTSAYNTLKSGGTIDITKYNDKVKSAIESLQSWYDKALECEKAVDELQLQLGELAKTKFDNVSTQFDNLVSRIEHSSNLINESITQAENKGYMDSTKFYESLIKNEQNTMNQRISEREQLVKSLQASVDDGSVKVGDDNWEEMQQKINEVSESIAKCKTNLTEYDNKIREINWATFDRGQESVKRLASEQDFLIDLMSNKKLWTDEGKMTNEGLATMGLHASNFDVYMKQADDYRDEMKRIQAEIANDPANTKLIDRKNELLDLQQQSIKSAEEEKNAIKSLVEDGIQKELSALQDVIDKYEEALDSQKDVQDYQRSLEDSTKEIASLRKKIAASSGDSSEEARANVQKWQSELKEKERDLEDKQYDRYISDQKDLLSDLYDEYEEILNKRTDNIDALLQKSIEEINANAQTVKTTLEEQSGNVGYKMTSELAAIWTDGQSGIQPTLSTYVKKFDTYASNALTAIGQVTDAVSKLQVAADQNAGTQVNTNENQQKADLVDGKSGGSGTGNGGTQTKTDDTSSKHSGIDPKSNLYKILTSGKSKKKVSSAEKKKHSQLWNHIVGTYKHEPTYKIYRKLADALGIKVKVRSNGSISVADSNKILSKIQEKEKAGYAKGTNYVPKDGYYWTQENGEEVLMSPNGAMYSPLSKGSKVFNADATQNLYQMANAPKDFFRDNVSNIPATKTIQSGDNTYQISIDLPGVTNYDEFKQALQNDKQMIKFWQNVTIGRANGKSSLSRFLK